MASKKDKYLESAQRFMLKGQLDKAIKDYQAVVALEPTETRYRQKLAELLVKDNRKEEAIAQYADIGKHYADNSYFLKAIAVYKQIQRLSPDKIDITLTLASLNHKQGLIGNALAEYGLVVAKYEKDGALKQAVKVVEQMIEVDAEQVTTRLKYGELLFASGSPDAAYEAFTTALGTLNGRGDTLAAQKVTERMAKLFPAQQQQSLEQVSELVAAGKLDEAIATLQQWLKRDAQDRQAWQLLSTALRRKGDSAALRTLYGQMLDQFPADHGMLKVAIRCEIEAGDAGGALALLERHLPRFIERGRPVPAEELLQAFPPHMADQFKVTEWLQHFYHASSGNAGAENPAAPVQALALPPEFDASAHELDLDAHDVVAEPPSAFGSPWGSEAPGAAEASAGEELPLPWEEEIDLDLDGEPHGELTAYGEIDLPLDFSLPQEFEQGDAASPFTATASPEALPSSLDDLSFLSETEPESAAAPAPGLRDDQLPEQEVSLELHDAPLELHDTPLELTLPGDGEAFPDFDWSEGADDGGNDVESFAGIDLAEELDGESPAEAGDEVEAPAVDAETPAPAQPRGWEEIYPEAAAADVQLDVLELESHYDLGIGYKEMGMYDGAIRELGVAAGNPHRRLACLALQAICYREKGETEKAQDLLQRGLELDVLSGEERRTLSYELAFLFEATGAVDQAVSLYREVHKADPSFNDVAARLFQLSGDGPADIIDLELEDADL